MSVVTTADEQLGQARDDLASLVENMARIVLEQLEAQALL